ncbi:NAD(P)-dependent oxidoreductase [Brevibacterium yomogidense]|uniref:NAD(P)-dependent oxidoreductase n=1 Tax=Brevibacterium yomogidense TaxID=946573 RepID=UPI0018DF59D8|nr:NAD(P)-dependent oxidoreductase [Brevibacterium yomogidense]
MSFSTPPRVSFVGIGAIGLPMALQLKSFGASVTGVDPFEASRERASAAGLDVEATPTSAAEADVVVVMVATPEQLRTAVEGDSGLIARMRPGSTLIVMSTVGPEAVVATAGIAEKAAVRILDVPVTGGVAGAKRSALTLFASGPADLIAEHEELLSAFGRVVSAGTRIGDGQSFKAVNQLLCSVHLAAAAEALAFAEKLGLDPHAALDAVQTGAGGSWMLGDRGPRMLEGLDAEVTSAVSIFVKDSGLVADIAESLDFDASLVRAARDRFVRAADAGLTARDDSQVIRTYLDEE